MTTERRKHTPESVMEELLACKTELKNNVKALGDGQGALREELAEHQQIVVDLMEDWEEFRKDFAELLSIFRSGRGFFKVLGWIGVFAKWTLVFGAAIAAVWVLITTGHWPGMGDK